MPPRMPRLACAVGLTLLLAVSCSTAPKETDEVTSVKTQAAQDSATGNGYLRQGRTVLALQFFTQSLSEYTSIDDGAGIVSAYNSVGKAYMAMGSLDQAEDMFTRARERARAESPTLLFISTNNLGELALARGDAQKALGLFQEALAMPAAARTPPQEAIVRHNIGTAEKNLGDLTEALKSYTQALDINLGRKLNAEAASDYYMIASVYSLQGSYGEAEANAQLALSFDKRVENSPGIGQDLYALGLIARKRSDLPAAYDYFQRAYLVFTTVNLTAETRKLLGELASTADALGRTAEGDAYRKTLAEMGPS